MDYITYEEFKRTDLYQQFISIVVYKDIGNYRVVFYSGETDSSGVISDIMLPAPNAIKDPDTVPPYTIYNMTAIHSRYETIKNYSIGMFGDVRVLQYVKMRQENSYD